MLQEKRSVIRYFIIISSQVYYTPKDYWTKNIYAIFFIILYIYTHTVNIVAITADLSTARNYFHSHCGSFCQLDRIIF